jgi:hypothetical protein
MPVHLILPDNFLFEVGLTGQGIRTKSYLLNPSNADRPPSARHPGAICNWACSKIRPLKQGRAAYEQR